jgi:hypothetical protein
MKKTILLISLAVTLAAVAVAQDAPKAEVSGNYSLLVYNPAKNLSGQRNLNGGGGAFVYNVGKYLGLKGEFQGYASTTATWVVPAGNASLKPGTYSTQANMFTYLFGPQINFRMKKARVFGEGLFGGAYTNGYAQILNTAGIGNPSATNNGFAMAMGGGIDINVSKRVAFRVAEVDYFLTRFQLPVLGTNNQSNFRYNAGIVFNLGGQ